MKYIFISLGISVCIPAGILGADNYALMSISIPSGSTVRIPDAQTLSARFEENETTKPFAKSNLPFQIGGKELSQAAVQMWVSVEVTSRLKLDGRNKADIVQQLLNAIYKD